MPSLLRVAGQGRVPCVAGFRAAMNRLAALPRRPAAVRSRVLKWLQWVGGHDRRRDA
jgi:hypothetical protein